MSGPAGPPKNTSMTVFWSEPLNFPWKSWNLNWVCLMGTPVPLIFFPTKLLFFPLSDTRIHIQFQASFTMAHSWYILNRRWYKQSLNSMLLSFCLFASFVFMLSEKGSRKRKYQFDESLHLQSMWGVRMVLEWEVLKWMIKAIFYAFQEQGLLCARKDPRSPWG